MTLKTILHPTDFSASASRALKLAARLAASHGATLHIFHAELLHVEAPAEKADALENYAERARRLLGQERRNGLPELKVSHDHSVFAFDAIMQATDEHHPELIVMGTHGRSGFSKLLMGSTAEKVLRHASCNVLTVKAGAAVPENGAFRRLLVPVDFSPWAGRGLDGARALREDADATIYLVHVVEPVPPMYYAGDVSSRFELDPDLRERIERNLRTWAGDLPDSKLVITEGSAALEVARLAEALEVDLIVMSTKGLTGAEHLLVGSVTERVCRFATVPVLTMR